MDAFHVSCYGSLEEQKEVVVVITRLMGIRERLLEKQKERDTNKLMLNLPVGTLDVVPRQGNIMRNK